MKKLTIRFKSGKIYEYENVDPDVVTPMDRNEKDFSFGKYFHQVVKPKHGKELTNEE